jgi:hypothetical protein
MPFAGPETALPATIVSEGGPTLIRGKITRPAARKGPSTTFQRLTRRLNDLQNNALIVIEEHGLTSVAAHSAVGFLVVIVVAIVVRSGAVISRDRQIFPQALRARCVSLFARLFCRQGAHFILVVDE